MFETMSTIDIVQCLGVSTTILVSIIGVVQSAIAGKRANDSDQLARKANDLAEKANKIAEKTLRDSQKDYMPLVRFCGEFNIASKDIKTLRSEITFDFDNLLLDLINNSFDLQEEDKLNCVTIEIENCGSGIVTGMEIEDFFIQSGNKVAIDIRSQEELDTMCYIQTACKEYFVLLPKEKAKVNFIIVNNIMDRNRYETLDEVWEYMHEFKKTFDNIVVSMSLKLDSLNNSTYQQDFLMGTYLDQKIVNNSFSKVSLKEHQDKR